MREKRRVRAIPKKIEVPRLCASSPPRKETVSPYPKRLPELTVLWKEGHEFFVDLHLFWLEARAAHPHGGLEDVHGDAKPHNGTERVRHPWTPVVQILTKEQRQQPRAQRGLNRGDTLKSLSMTCQGPSSSALDTTPCHVLRTQRLCLHPECMTSEGAPFGTYHSDEDRKNRRRQD